MEVIRNKLITFHISKVGNDEVILYYNQNLINYKDLKSIPNFREMDKIPIFYKKIYKVPIYLANMDQKDYLSRKILDLENKLKNNNFV